MLNTRKKALTILIWSAVCVLGLSACGRKTVVTRESQPAMIAESATLKVWVKDSNGKPVRATREVVPGEFVLGDPNGAKPVPPTPMAAPKAEIVPIFPAKP